MDIFVLLLMFFYEKNKSFVTHLEIYLLYSCYFLINYQSYINI